MEIKIIKTEEQYNKVVERVGEIIREGNEGNEEFELLTLLINDYEEKLFHIPVTDPIDIIKYLMEENDLKQKDLIDVFGDNSNASKVLNRKRPLSLNMIRNLCDRFSLSADLFI